MQIRDRIKEIRRVDSSTLKPNPKNWRTHPKKQQEALKGLLADVGYAVPALVRELEDGSLMLIDGHLRAETIKGIIPVCVLDVTEEEADLLLATIDPLSTLAGQDDAKIAELLAGVQSDSAAVQAMLAALYKLPEEGGPGEAPIVVPEKFEVLLTCDSEKQQAELLEEFAVRGLTCRSLIS
jgi:hypothetical protein